MQTRILAVATCLLLLALTATADELPRTISVSGSGHIDAAPDIARLSLAVQNRDPSMKLARDRTVKVSNDFLALMKKLGIKDAKVRTSGITINPSTAGIPRTTSRSSRAISCSASSRSSSMTWASSVP